MDQRATQSPLNINGKINLTQKTQSDRNPGVKNSLAMSQHSRTITDKSGGDK